MRLCFFNENRLGLVKGDRVHDVTAALDVLPFQRFPYPCHDQMVAALPELRSHIEKAAGGAGAPIASVHLLSPIANPGKIFAAPVNYQKHLQEAIQDPETFARAHVRKI